MGSSLVTDRSREKRREVEMEGEQKQRGGGTSAEESKETGRVERPCSSQSKKTVNCTHAREEEGEGRENREVRTEREDRGRAALSII